MTAVNWCCVFNLSCSAPCQACIQWQSAGDVFHSTFTNVFTVTFLRFWSFNNF